jgi:hypothetical protein
MDPKKAEVFGERMVGLLNAGGRPGRDVGRGEGKGDVAGAGFKSVEVRQLSHDIQNVHFIIKKN